MSQENLPKDEPNNQMRLFEHLDVYYGLNNKVTSLETNPLQRFAYAEGLEYLRYIVNLGKESVLNNQSFRAEFQIEVPIDQSLDFYEAMKSNGCHISQCSLPEVCDYCHEDVKQTGGIAYSCTCCGGKQYHDDCGIYDFYDHWDHDCFPACCKKGHPELTSITVQDFFDTVPEISTYIEEDYRPENIESESIVYTITHIRISFNDRLEIAHRDFKALQKSSEMAETKKRLRMHTNNTDILD